jgi:hypothetical protein
MKNESIESPEFIQACWDLANATYKGKVPQEILDGILRLTPNPNEKSKMLSNTLSAPVSTSATAKVTAAFIYGTLNCEISSQNKYFDGTHWGVGLAGFAATGIIYTAYDNWQAFFDNAKGYHIQCVGAAAGVVQISWFTKGGTPVGQFNGVAGGAGAMEVGGSGSWKNL